MSTRIETSYELTELSAQASTVAQWMKPPLESIIYRRRAPAQVLAALPTPVRLGKLVRWPKYLGPCTVWETPMEFQAPGLVWPSPDHSSYFGE